jgi:hypothetical protein
MIVEILGSGEKSWPECTSVSMNGTKLKHYEAFKERETLSRM